MMLDMLAIDSEGNAYITGYTSSINYPTTIGAYDTTANGSFDVFVTKVNSTGSALLYSTILGGSDEDGFRSYYNWEQGGGIAIDNQGNAYITGYTASADFPTTINAYDRIYNGNGDSYVSKLDATGSDLIYSTFIGGSNIDHSIAITVDNDKNAYITGYTNSSLDFPITLGAYDTTNNGSYDVFVMKLDTTGSSLEYSTFIGGSSDDFCYGICIDSIQNVYLCGRTESANFPVTPGAFDTIAHPGFWHIDSFISKLNAAGSGLIYSTYLGGDGDDIAYAITLNSTGNAYITGMTTSSDFPTTLNAVDRTINNAYDVFVTELNATATVVLYSTFLGGTEHWGESGRSIAVDNVGTMYVTGATLSSDFPITPGAIDSTYNSGNLLILNGGDAFIAIINPAHSTLLYSSYLGNGSGNGIAIDSYGEIYIVGNTGSPAFPTTDTAFDRVHNGASDVFVSKLKNLDSIFTSVNPTYWISYK